MSRLTKTLTAMAAILSLAAGAVVLGHELTVKGTVAGIEPTRIQVKTGEEKKTDAPLWYPIDAKTKIMRGKAVLTFQQSRIALNERVVLIVDHESDSQMRTLEIRLAEAKAK